MKGVAARMKVSRIECVIIGFVVILFLMSFTDTPERKVGQSPDRYTELIEDYVKKALSATEGYLIPIKYENYDRAKAMAKEYKVLTEKFSDIVEDCPKERYREKNMLKAAMNVVANRNSSLWAYTMYVEARTFDKPNISREQERTMRYINDAEKYRRRFYDTYGF